MGVARAVTVSATFILFVPLLGYAERREARSKQLPSTAMQSVGRYFIVVGQSTSSEISAAPHTSVTTESATQSRGFGRDGDAEIWPVPPGR